MAINAQVVELVDLYANWLLRVKGGEGLHRKGLIKFLTIILSVSLDKMGRTEIGR